ncbi:hypothetical protein [Curtobacterium sp. ISL-83]|uniref:hypothetical protein n=1 Tax=Curtobacterium sp. ISL-83 TaxID=2819145 RepID=UPI001BE6EEF2|nr:hypothetical protein [Curtobacterium sp. ISL-83]MBT2502933.1 hypothetical protein [Curtobacterium sp. ISL-83]
MGDTTAAAATRPRTDVFDVLIRPRRSLVRSTALSIVFSAVPLAVALLWVSFPFRLWALVAAVVLALAVVVGIAFVRLGTAYIGIDSRGVVIHGVVTTNQRVPRERVHHLVLATTFGHSADRTTRELVAFDADGAHLFRMRADVWGDAGIDRVAEALGVQVTEEPRPIAWRVFAKRYPTSRAWYEYTSAFLVVGSVAVLVVVGLLAVETAGLAGS